MKISLVNGVLKIDGKEVLTIVFLDGETMRFPAKDVNEIVIDNAGDNIATAVGDKNVVISGKNIVHGSIMNVKGDFRLGDG